MFQNKSSLSDETRILSSVFVGINTILMVYILGGLPVQDSIKYLYELNFDGFSNNILLTLGYVVVLIYIFASLMLILFNILLIYDPNWISLSFTPDITTWWYYLLGLDITFSVLNSLLSIATYLEKIERPDSTP